MKALYVKNIPDNTSTEKLKEVFQRHGEVTKVVMPPGKAGKRDFGFIHYAERSSALKAVKDTEKYEIDGNFSHAFPHTLFEDKLLVWLLLKSFRLSSKLFKEKQGAVHFLIYSLYCV